METILLIILGLVIALIVSLRPRSHESEQYEIEKRKQLAQIRLTEARADQVAHQQQGVIERYRMTQENRINAMLRQQRQEIEIEKLKAQVKLLQRELGKNNPDDFTPNP